MLLTEYGFRPVYHNVCIFKLNDKLRDLIQACPDAAKSSHAVCYGYIDAKKGLMFEVLCGGKQAPKYFYFKDIYEGERITIPASELKDVEFDTFVDLEPRFQKKLKPRIEPLKKYDAPEELEKTRSEELGFLDAFRDTQHPDIVRVSFLKNGLQVEEVPVRLTGIGDHCLLGVIQKKPKQDFGLNKGDSIRFNARQNEENKIEIYVNLNEEHELTKEDLEDISFLKYCIGEFLKNTENQDAFGFLLAVLRSSSVVVPCDVHLSSEAEAIMDKLKADGKDLDSLEGEDAEVFQNGMSFIPRILENSGHQFFPAFTSVEEIRDQLEDAARVNMPFLHAVEMALDGGSEIEGIVVNAFTDNFIANRELFDTICKMKPLFDQEQEEEPESEFGMQNFTNHEDLALAVFVGKMDAFNYALYQNKVNPIQGIRIMNDTGDPLTGLSLRITSDFEFFEKYETSLPSIPSGKPISLPDPHLKVKGKELVGMTDAVNAVITVELCKNGETICGVRGHMLVLAYNQWMGGIGYRFLLPAFVIPTHPVIPALMHDAADRLGKWGKNSSLEGYQSHDPNRVRELAAAAYAAVQKKNIVYAEPPVSFFTAAGQQIRTPEIIMEQRLGTCMDMTLLYAALLEAIGLHPMLVLIQGHIFAGVWLKERTPEELQASNVIIDNVELLTMRINNGSDEMTFIECTAMCSGKQVNFEEAEMVAKQSNLDPSTFKMAIDVFLSRFHGIKPIPPRMKEGGEYQIEISDKEDDEITDAPTNLGISIADISDAKPGRKITSKRELWESKLLDLSTHNMLLNLPLNSSIEPIMSSHIDELEDALADGHEFHLLPAAEWIVGLSYTKTDKDGKESKPIQWLQEAIKEQGIFELTNWPVSANFDFNEKFRQEYRNHRLYTYCTPKQLERELTTIYRAARASQQENGVSSLYLAVGLLRWFAEPDSKDPCYAPLILIPIEIVRKSANQGYALHAREDEPHFNTTLLEMLKQNFNIDIGGLNPLPADEHGINIKKAFALVRNALFTVKGWDIVETCVIGNFSFAQFVMWNDIHTAGETLENSNIVRSLIKGHVDWDVSSSPNLDDEQTYLPITVDATQLQAIKMAAHGSTFVLHGPPGTGKSQTITGMIANLMAQGKKVLFVAEKMAALSVVQRRLSSLGIGDFCLELHSDKANKKQVLTQLDKALAIKHPSHRTEYEEYLKRASASRAKLDGYAKHLHKVHECGYSLRELIDLYETVRDSEYYVSFDRNEAGMLTQDQIKQHSALIGQLIALGEAIGGISGHPLTGVRLTSYSADVRGSLHRYVEIYIEAIETVRDAGACVSEKLGVDAPKNKAALSSLKELITLFNEGKDTEPLFLSLLSTDSTPAYAYFTQEEEVIEEEQELLSTWMPEFLKQDMNSILTKHEAAGKKFFGKGSAMAAVTAEVQAYAIAKVTYEQIPVLLQRVKQYQARVQNLQKVYTELPEEVRKLIDQLKSKDAYQSAQEAAFACKKQAEAFPGGLDAIMALAAQTDGEKAFADYKEKHERMLSAEENFNNLLKRKDNNDIENWFESELEFCRYLMRHASELKDWGLYNQVRQECVKVGLMPVVEAYENNLKACELEKSYKKGLYYALINYVISKDDVLSSFSGVAFNESIQQFKKLDDQMLQQTKQEIYYLLASRVPASCDSAEVGMELNLLRKAIGSNARGMSIRTLFDRIPHVLQILCPCMLMSPNSVAQYLAQDNNLFDVVIFDEASQLLTCKAIGALSRAKNAVIVGDPKQMPPTAFFAGSGPEVDDLALDDLDSILDDALALGIPSQHLQWHYRSTHESLIAFSNNQFYENKMYTFPSANDRERHVTAVHVEGLYSKSTNVKEAEAVVEEIVRRFLDPELNKQSIGVVTFNVKQQTLIENLLAKQFQSNPELDLWANGGEDPLFVKNLENVQGDERDVILFSTGYGPDEKGQISMNFGPINKADGGKRLNVAFSRARVTMTIFASLYSSDIKVTENSPEGLIAFRDFLKFAEGQDIRTESSAEAAAKLAKAGILQSICSAITEHGYQCETMVGHSDFHVDIAVVDPFVPTRYMMGILLDGDGYRQTKNTRDREVVQISVLKNLGWALHRVWTIDWWDNREKVLDQLLNKLDALKDASAKKIEEQKAAEEARKVEEAAREAEANRVKAELEAQAAEVVAEDEEAENSERIVDIPVSTTEPVADNPIEEAPVQTEEKQNAIVTSEKVSLDKVPEEQEKPEEQSQNDTSEDAKDQGQALVVILQKVTDAKGEIIDKRNNGGALWIVGGKNLTPIMKEFNALGIHFIYKSGGGKATGGKDGWWAKTDVVLPNLKRSVDTTANATQISETKTIESPDDKIVVETPTESIASVSEKPEIQVSIEQVEESVSNNTESTVLTEYVEAVLPMSNISQSEFASPGNKTEIANRILAVLSVEAPILKDTLFRRVWASFGIQKTTSAIDATEKAFKLAKVKTTKQKGIVFCWTADQEPKTYSGIRISNSRTGDEICQQEMKNAVCFVLEEKGELEKDDLIKEVSLVFGYKRLGKNLEAALAVGVQYAKTSGSIVSVAKGKFGLAKGTETTQESVAIPNNEPEVVAKEVSGSPEVMVSVPAGETALYCENENYKAVGVRQGTGFTVLRGSRINAATTPSCPASAIAAREKYAEAIGSDYVLVSDISFASPSGAACFVAGASRNGYTEWHSQDGTMLKDL